MKTSFRGYYPPTPEEYERLWREATIVLDTNVLLNLYRLPTAARDEFFTVLELLKDRLWIPHQVALEFQRNRLTVIAAERKSTEEALGAAQSIVGDLRKKVDALQIEKRGLGIDTKPVLDDLQRANEKLVAAIEATHAAQLEIASTDPIRERMDSLLVACIGPGPTSQLDLDALVQDGEARFREEIPPGFADSEKGKNPNDATFIHDQLRYQKKFGDLILWRQLLEHSKSKNLKCILLVTADRKEDWWWREQGKTIGAHPELVSEIHRNSAVDIFWMYSSVQFIQHAVKYAAAEVSPEAVKELQQVVVAPVATPVRHALDMQYMREKRQRLMRDDEPIYERIDNSQTQASIENWLATRFNFVRKNLRGFPDFIANDGQNLHGFEVAYLRNLDRIFQSPALASGLMRGYMETREGRLSSFTMIVAVDESIFFETLQSKEYVDLERKSNKFLSKYPVDSIVIGANIDNRFEVLVWTKNMPSNADEDLDGNTLS